VLTFKRIKIISSLILILSLAFSLFYIFGTDASSSKWILVLVPVIILSGCIFTIMFTYLLFGRWAVVFVFFCLASTIILSARSGNPQYLLFCLPFIVSGIVSHKYLEKEKVFTKTHAFKLNELTREINQLRQEIGRNKELKLVLQKRLEGYSALKELMALLSSSLHMNEVIHFITEESFRIVGKTERVLLFLVDEESQKLALTGSRKLDTDSRIKSRAGDGCDNWVLEHRRPLIITDTTKDERFYTLKEKDTRKVGSLISAPLMLEDKILGVLRLEATERHAYTADDLRILCVIADISAVAVKNAFLYAKTEELAIKDGLTGLYVHRYFKERLEAEVKRASRQQYRFSLLMIDIDSFKKYNDRYGHAAGDIVLQHIARSLYKFADVGDFIARYGGEEFAVILAEEDKKEALASAEDIRKHIANDSVFLRGQRTYVTVSIGVATYPADATTQEDLIKIADANLYRAKREGRNRVCS